MTQLLCPSGMRRHRCNSSAVVLDITLLEIDVQSLIEVLTQIRNAGAATDRKKGGKRLQIRIEKFQTPRSWMQFSFGVQLPL